MFPIPDALVQTANERLGAHGLAWLDRLPAILSACERRWSLRSGAPFPRISDATVEATRRAMAP